MVNRSSTHARQQVLRRFVHVGVALIALLPSATVAAEGSFTNEQTGSGSQNENTAAHNTDVSASFSNVATIDNTFTLDLNTGGNTIENNTTVGDVTTGAVDVDIESTTTVNAVDADALSELLGAVDDSFTISGQNSLTGANSVNTNQVTQTRVFTFSQQNTMTVTNTVNAAINTGNNSIADNTTVGDIATGPITVDVNVTTQGNGAGGGLLPGEDDNGGGNNGTGNGSTGPVTIAQLPPSQISAPVAKPATSTTAQGGGQFFPAGSNGQLGIQLMVFALVAILLVRLSELLPTLFVRLQHRTVPLRVQ